MPGQPDSRAVIWIASMAKPRITAPSVSGDFTVCRFGHAMYGEEPETHEQEEIELSENQSKQNSKASRHRLQKSWRRLSEHEGARSSKSTDRFLARSSAGRAYLRESHHAQQT